MAEWQSLLTKARKTLEVLDLFSNGNIRLFKASLCKKIYELTTPRFLAQINKHIIAKNNTAALKANERCMPIRPPPKPTVKPLKVRPPKLPTLNSPMALPLNSVGALSCARVRVIELKDKSKKPAQTNRRNDKI